MNNTTFYKTPQVSAPIGNALDSVWQKKVQRAKRIAVASVWIMVLLATIISCNAANAESVSADGHYMYVTVSSASRLNLRRDPRDTGFICAVAFRGEKLLVNSISSDGWASVGKDPYYCSAEYLSDDPPHEKVGIVVSNGRVALRTSPGGKRVSWVHNGDTVVLTSFARKDNILWYVTDENRYILAEYVRITE